MDQPADTDETAASVKPRLNDGRHPKALTYARWMLWWNGRPYRLVMRYMHRHGWCYPSRANVQPQMVWCHWCGMRGRVPGGVTADEMRAAMADTGRSARSGGPAR